MKISCWCSLSAWWLPPPGTWRKVLLEPLCGVRAVNAGLRDDRRGHHSQQYYTGTATTCCCWSPSGGCCGQPSGPPYRLEQSTDDEPASRWVDLAPRLAHACHSFPAVVGLWTCTPTGPRSPAQLSSPGGMSATLVLGLFVFFKQFPLDRQLISLLDQSRRSYANCSGCKLTWFRKEKLRRWASWLPVPPTRSNIPWPAILGYPNCWRRRAPCRASRPRWPKRSGSRRDAPAPVADLLSFSQQNPSEKVLVDVSALVQRALQMHEVQVQRPQHPG